MSEIKIREIANGWVATCKAGYETAFSEEEGDHLLHWLSGALGIVPKPPEQPTSLDPSTEIDLAKRGIDLSTTSTGL